MKMKQFLALLLALTLTLSLTACGGQTSSDGSTSGGSSDSASTSPDTDQTTSSEPTVSTTDKTQLVVGADYEPTDLQYYTNATDSSKIINAAIYDTLFTNVNGEIVPSLATGYEYGGDDGLDLTIHLQEGVTFSNGDPFTAEDVLFTLQENLSSLAVATKFASVDIAQSYAADDNTVVLKLTNYDNCLLAYLCGEYGQILDKTYVEELGEDTAIGQKPIGTGPYVFDSWEVGTSITLVKNETYWGDSSNQSFESIKYMFYADDSVRSLELEAGNLDIALLNTNDSITRVAGESDQGLNVYSVPLTKVGSFCMATTIADDTFQDVNKRLAVAYAVDWAAIVETVAGATAVAATSILPSGVDGYVNNAYEYDVDKAKEYLAAAGCPDGFSFDMEVANNQQMNLELATAIQAYLSMVGINMNVIPEDFGTQFGNMLAGTELCSIMVGTCNGDASMGLTAFAPGSGLCISENNDATFVDLLNQCRTESDPATRAQLLSDLQQYMHDTAYAIPVYEATYNLGYQSYVTGVDGSNIQGELGLYVTRLSFVQ
jgi:peptide/nickel transport system substrate-binding protein